METPSIYEFIAVYESNKFHAIPNPKTPKHPTQKIYTPKHSTYNSIRMKKSLQNRKIQSKQINFPWKNK